MAIPSACTWRHNAGRRWPGQVARATGGSRQLRKPPLAPRCASCVAALPWLARGYAAGHHRLPPSATVTCCTVTTCRLPCRNLSSANAPCAKAASTRALAIVASRLARRSCRRWLHGAAASGCARDAGRGARSHHMPHLLRHCWPKPVLADDCISVAPCRLAAPVQAT